MILEPQLLYMYMHLLEGELDFDLGQVFIQVLQSHLVLMLERLVQLSIPVRLPRLHVLRSKALQRQSTLNTILHGFVSWSVL